jgi:hypothetical protein
MILSSHYVLKDILHTLERRDLEETKKLCEKYCERYRNDQELIKACSLMSERAGSLRDRNMSEMKNKLEELLSARKMDVSGGTNLWYSDRRKSTR